MATIIKAGSEVSSSSGQEIQPVAFDFGDMAQQADRYLDEVRRQAAQIIQQAHQEAEQYRRRAEEEGRKVAQAAVEKLLDEKMKTLLPALRKSIEDIHHSKAEWLRYWERSAVKVAGAIAGRLIRRPLAETPEITLELVREALALAAGSSEITLRLHPQDHENLSGQTQTLAAELTKLSSARVIADPTIELGSCRVDTEFGSIDQQFQAQLERIEEELA